MEINFAQPLITGLSMTNLKKWQIIKSELVFNNRWCQVRQDAIKLSDGQIIDDYFVNIRPEIVLVVPVTRDNQLVFVRQYRHGVREILLEFPAGAVDANEDNISEAARREFEEETGYQSDPLIPLAILYDNPVKDTNRIHIFLALNATATGKQKLDITEEIEVILRPLQTINPQEITVSGSLAAFYLARDFLTRELG
jgi:8-oxo-dGTP pyrophosphatase MutT (NUDIX family)